MKDSQGSVLHDTAMLSLCDHTDRLLAMAAYVLDWSTPRRRCGQDDHHHRHRSRELLDNDAGCPAMYMNLEAQIRQDKPRRGETG